MRALGKSGVKLNWQTYQRLFLKAQRRVERRHRKQRVDLMIYEKQRQETLKDIGADPYVD
jgi:preprotein translocase subunit SecA